MADKYAATHLYYECNCLIIAYCDGYVVNNKIFNDYEEGESEYKAVSKSEFTHLVNSTFHLI